MRDVLWLVGLAGLVSLHFWFPPIDTGVRHDTYSTAAEGKKAFYLLARKHFTSVDRNLDSLPQFVNGIRNSRVCLCLLGPARNPTPQSWDALLAWVAGGGSLLIAKQDDGPGFSVEQLNLQVKEDGPTTGRINSELVGEANGKWRSRGAIDAPEAEVLVKSAGRVQAVRRQHGLGRVVVVASDWIFSNRSLMHEDNSVLAVRLVKATGSAGPVYFDESLNLTGTPKVVGLLLTPLLRPLTVQLLIALLVFGWWRSRRFGPTGAAEISLRHNIVDHTNTLGSLYYRSRDGTAALRSYMSQLIRETRLKRFKGREDLVLKPIADRLGQQPEEVKDLLLRANRAAQRGQVNRRTAAEFIRRLAEIRQAHNADGGMY